MKKIFIVVFILLFFKSNSQTPVLQLWDFSNVEGAYYKDLDNKLDPFAGTWKYTNGTTSLTITLQKKLMQEYNDGSEHFFHDIVVGECKYIENGNEKINTLSELSLQKSPFQYSITGNILYGPNDTLLKTSFSQANINIFGMETGMFFERVDSEGVQKLKVIFKMTEGPTYIEGDGPPVVNFAIPFGTYIMIKQ